MLTSTPTFSMKPLHVDCLPNTIFNHYYTEKLEINSAYVADNGLKICVERAGEYDYWCYNKGWLLTPAGEQN